MSSILSKAKVSFVLFAVTTALIGCEDFEFPKPKAETDESADQISVDGKKINLEERDVEAPDVFQKTGKALWDGRPSLGGVWVAHPDAKKPERVLIRNNDNNKTVVGALFNKESSLPGPALQLSSDAAVSLGVQAGSTTNISVVALRRETIEIPDEKPEMAKPQDLEEVKSSKLAEIPAPKVVATEKAVAKTAPKEEVVATTPKPRPLAKPKVKSKLRSPYVQVGSFSVEANAKATVKKIENFNVPAQAIKSTKNGKNLWRVIAGPAQTAEQQKQILEKMQSLGFKDAILVKG